MTGHTCLHCHKPIEHSELVPAPPAGYAHRTCEDKHRAENPEHPRNVVDPDIDRIINANQKEHEYILSTAVKIRGGNDSIVWPIGTVVVRKGTAEEYAPITARYSESCSKITMPTAYKRLAAAVRPLTDEDERSFTVRRQRMLVRVDNAGLSYDVAAVLLALIDSGYMRDQSVDRLLRACTEFDVKPDQQWNTALMYRVMVVGLSGGQA